MQALGAVFLIALLAVIVAAFILAAPLAAPDGTHLTNLLDLSPQVAAVGTERLEITHETLRRQGEAAYSLEQHRITARTQNVALGIHAAAVLLSVVAVAVCAQLAAAAWARAWAARPPAPPPNVLLLHAGFLLSQGHNVDLVREGRDWVVADYTRKMLIDPDAEEVISRLESA